MGYDGVGLLDLTGPFTVFWSASWFLSQRGEAPYERRVATVGGGPVNTADGMTLVARAPLPFRRRAHRYADRAWRARLLPARRSDRVLIDWLVKNAPRAAPRLFGVHRNVRARGGGSARRQASGHALAGGGKSAHAVSDSQGAAGCHFSFATIPCGPPPAVSAGIDLALALVQEDCGRDVAMSVARQLGRLHAAARRADAVQRAARCPGHGNVEPFAELHDWLATHLHDETLSVETLARTRVHERAQFRARLQDQDGTHCRRRQSSCSDSRRRGNCWKTPTSASKRSRAAPASATRTGCATRSSGISTSARGTIGNASATPNLRPRRSRSKDGRRAQRSSFVESTTDDVVRSTPSRLPMASIRSSISRTDGVDGQRDHVERTAHRLQQPHGRHLFHLRADAPRPASGPR